GKPQTRSGNPTRRPLPLRTRLSALHRLPLPHHLPGLLGRADPVRVARRKRLRLRSPVLPPPERLQLRRITARAEKPHQPPRSGDEKAATGIDSLRAARTG